MAANNGRQFHLTHLLVYIKEFNLFNIHIPFLGGFLFNYDAACPG